MSTNLDEKFNAPGETGDPEPEPQPSETAVVPDLASLLSVLETERAALVAERSELIDRLLRRQAEFDNFRKRVERDRLEFAEYAGMEAVRAILPVVDDFERALKVESADKEFTKGMELIYSRLFDALKKMGLEPIEAAGAKFDPNVHYAIDRVAGADAEDETVIEQFQRGYYFKGKLLRPAMVKVAVK